MDDAIAVQPDEGACNAADDEYRVARARDAVGAQADRVLEHEVQLAALGEGAVHAHNVGMSAGELQVFNLAEQRVAARLFAVGRLLDGHRRAQHSRAIDLRVAAVREVAPRGGRREVRRIERREAEAVVGGRLACC